MNDVITINESISCWIIFWTTYWIFGSIITWLLDKYKIREVTELKSVIFSLFNSMLWTLIGLILICFIPFRIFVNSHIIVKLILNYILTDIWFYHVHILLHHPQLYPKLHKMHHKFKKPYALTALYCTGYESIFLNVFSTSLGPFIFQIPYPYLYIWFFLVSLNSLLSHSGLKIPFLIDNAHDDHHLYFNYNYGVSGYIDMLYGTSLPVDSNESKSE